MRRTILNATALACLALFASTAPAMADDPTPTPSAPAGGTKAPSTEPTTAPGDPKEGDAPVGGDDQVSVVPGGAPDTGAVSTSSDSGQGTLIGGGAAAAVLLGGGATVLVMRRRRATGA